MLSSSEARHSKEAKPAMSDTVPNLDPAHLSSLPISDRITALYKSDLVARYRPGWWGSGLLICDGAVHSQDPYTESKSAKAHPFRFPSHLVRPEDASPLAAQARGLMFSANRFVLSGSPAKNLDFLRSYSPADLARIRQLDLQVPYDAVEQWRTSEGTPTFLGEFRALVEHLAAGLDLPQLHLALDCGTAFEIYQEQQCTEEVLGYVLNAYKALTTVIVEALNGGRRPMTFRVYLACFHAYEAEAEQAVMGSEYDSQKDGGPRPKVPTTERNPYFPHGDVEDVPDFGPMELS